MAQDPGQAALRAQRYAGYYGEVRWAALREPETSIAVVRAYQDFLRRNDEFDPAGPGAMVELVATNRRLIVVGRVAAATHQLDRVIAQLEAAGGTIEDRQDDDRIGVSLLTVSGLDAESLHDLVRTMATEIEPGAEPLAVGLDDVTYQADPQGVIIIKPVTGQGATGGAIRTDLAVPRPTPSRTEGGAGVMIGVIDGAFESAGAPARSDGWSANVTAPNDGVHALNQVDPSRLDPGAGHGTFVTGVVASRAPDARIQQYRATDSFGFGCAWRLKDCLLQALDDGCRVINISLGFEDPDLIGSPALSAALHQVPSDVVVVAAAGNAGTTTPMLPAAHKNVVAVGGLELDLAPVGWSNRGPWVDFSTQANPVLSTYVVDPNDPAPAPDPWAYWAGTSFAAPKVAGELAVLLGGGKSPTEAIAELRARAARPQPSPDFGYVLDLPDLFTL